MRGRIFYCICYGKIDEILEEIENIASKIFIMDYQMAD
jgi:hypothetical protein